MYRTDCVRPLTIGVDIGSTTVKVIIVKDGEVVYQQYERHLSQVRPKTLELIRTMVREKHIHRLFFEAHWMYRNRLQQMREFMRIPITFKIGVETFDEEFREGYLNKHADFHSPEEVRRYFDSPCLMVGIKGQTKEMIDYDIRMLKEHFELGTVNVFTDNSTDVKRDQELVDWFMEKYAWLLDDPTVEVLYEKTDFGVGD